jgi:hypothetical protein
MNCSVFVSINNTLIWSLVIILFHPWQSNGFFVTVHLIIQRSYNFPHHNISAMNAPFPICCNNCHDKQHKCKVCPHSKGSCHHCFLNSLECLSLPHFHSLAWISRQQCFSISVQLLSLHPKPPTMSV